MSHFIKTLLEIVVNKTTCQEYILPVTCKKREYFNSNLNNVELNSFSNKLNLTDDKMGTV
jgi:hypothetical protein